MSTVGVTGPARARVIPFDFKNAKPAPSFVGDHPIESLGEGITGFPKKTPITPIGINGDMPPAESSPPPKPQEHAPQPDDAVEPDAALAFLDDFFGTDKHHLVAIRKHNGKTIIEAHHFDAVDRTGQEKFITGHSAAGFDVYFSPNPIKGTLHKKANKNDVVEARHLWIDLDPRPGKPREAERAEMLALLTTNLPPGMPQPNRVIDSGRGFWGYWKLAPPQPVDGGNNGMNGPLTGAVECYGRGIEQAFGDRFADGCRNIDRIARLPGTVNRKTGKLARVLHEYTHDTPHPIESFPRREKPEPSDHKAGKTGGTEGYEPVTREGPEWGKFSAVWVTRIFDGDIEGKYKNDRSRTAFAVACELVRAGFDDDFVSRVLMTTRCGAHVQESPGYRLPRTLVRARAVASDPNLTQMNEEYSAGSVAGKFRVLRWMPDASYPFQWTCEFQTKNDFCSSTVNPKVEVPKFNNKGIQVGTEPKARGLWWLGQDHRREFDGIDFRPGAPAIIERPTSGGRILEIVNMYSGLSCAPSTVGEAGCGLFLAHVHDNICGADDQVYGYVLDWMASGVQHPEDPGRSRREYSGCQGTRVAEAPERAGTR